MKNFTILLSLITLTAIATPATATTKYKQPKQTGKPLPVFYNLLERHRIWLNFSVGTEVGNQILIGYIEGATDGVDVGYDGSLIVSGDTMATLMGTTGTQEYSIQARGLPFNVDDVVRLSVNALADGPYTISFDHADGLFTTQDIYLRDNFLGVVNNIKLAPYTFMLTAGINQTRFELLYTPTLNVAESSLKADKVQVALQNGILHINSGEVTMSTVNIFDTNGRLIYQKSNINTNQTTLPALKATGQLLLVQITSTEGNTVTKKVLN